MSFKEYLAEAGPQASPLQKRVFLEMQQGMAERGWSAGDVSYSFFANFGTKMRCELTNDSNSQSITLTVYPTRIRIVSGITDIRAGMDVDRALKLFDEHILKDGRA